MPAVWIVWEQYFQSFDIVADERLTIVGVYVSEEAAYCAVEDLGEAQKDECITYYYEEHKVRDYHA